MLRQATADDIPAIRALMQAVPGFWQTHWSDHTLAQAIGSAHGLAFVWENDTGLAGFVCAHDVGFRAYLSELVVAEQARRQSIGKQLVQRIEHELAARGHTILISDVWQDAIPFYRSMGWEPPAAVLLRKRIQEDA